MRNDPGCSFDVALTESRGSSQTTVPAGSADFEPSCPDSTMETWPVTAAAPARAHVRLKLVSKRQIIVVVSTVPKTQIRCVNAAELKGRKDVRRQLIDGVCRVVLVLCNPARREV